jgi:mediator of RNA polymerase II transcription subunit 13
LFAVADGDGMKDSTPQSSTVSENPYDDDEREVPSVVVYLVEPFSLGSDQPELQRLACLALLRCFQSVLASVPENIRNNISVQVRPRFR